MEEEIIIDSAGAGQWDSAPACRFILAPRRDLGVPMTAAYSCDGQINRPRGVLGGEMGNSSAAWKYNIEGGMETRTELSPFAEPEILPGEAIVSESSGAGGFGSPLDRDPELVRFRVREGWTSVEKAFDIYGVVLDLKPEKYAVDYDATQKRRDELRNNDKLRKSLRKKWIEASWRSKRLPMNESWAQDFFKFMREQHGEEIAKSMVKEA